MKGKVHDSECANEEGREGETQLCACIHVPREKRGREGGKCDRERREKKRI